MHRSQFSPSLPQHTDRPPCPFCGIPMWLARIEPDAPGCDRRTFECAQCDHEESVVVKFK